MWARSVAAAAVRKCAGGYIYFIYIVCLNVDCNITAIIDSVSAPFSSLLELDRGLGPVLASRAQPSPAQTQTLNYQLQAQRNRLNLNNHYNISYWAPPASSS